MSFNYTFYVGPCLKVSGDLTAVEHFVYQEWEDRLYDLRGEFEASEKDDCLYLGPNFDLGFERKNVFEGGQVTDIAELKAGDIGREVAAFANSIKDQILALQEMSGVEACVHWGIVPGCH